MCWPLDPTKVFVRTGFLGDQGQPALELMDLF